MSSEILELSGTANTVVMGIFSYPAEWFILTINVMTGLGSSYISSSTKFYGLP